jgi:hypothetical protein
MKILNATLSSMTTQALTRCFDHARSAPDPQSLCALAHVPLDVPPAPRV